MKVALVHPYPWTEVRRGGERYVGDLAWYLHGRGHAVDVLTSTAGRSRTWTVDGVRVRAGRRIRPGWLRRHGVDEVQTHASSVLPFLARHRYDVVHALTPWGAMAARLARQRVVYTELGHPTLAEVEQSPGGLRLYRSALRSADAVTALSRSAAAAVEAVAGVAAEVVPPGVRTDVFTTGPLPADVGAPSAPHRILFASDAGQWRKGVDVAIAALALLQADHPDLRLALGGPGDHRWALDRLGVGADDNLVGAIDVLGVGGRGELPGRYRDATLTVLPSTHEAFGLVLVESLASGTPVVCSDDSGMVDVVTDPAIGRTFAPGDATDLARATAEVLALAAGPGTAARCRSHARRWGWVETVGPAHDDLYRRVRSGPGAG